MSGAPPDAAAPASLETLSPEELLGMAREQIATGKIEGALDAVVRAIREKCGADRVLTMLAEAKDYANHHRDPGFKSPTEGKTQREILLDAVSGKDSILAEEYDDASEGLKKTVRSGESRVCIRCGDVIATARLQAHSRYWCPANPPQDDSDSD